jgi:hypothetical protein
LYIRLAVARAGIENIAENTTLELQQKVIVDLWFLGSETTCPYVGVVGSYTTAPLRMDG